MVIKKNQIFNLMDTNGRRSDVLNALRIYLEILEELKAEYPTEGWATYPSSISQFLFYQRALEKSKGVLNIHKNYDRFLEALGAAYPDFIGRKEEWIRENFADFAEILDESIEKRARHYTSTLVKMGFTDANRQISEAGYSYLRGRVVRDDLEKLLPLDNVNLVLLRQLAKLKVFGESNGKTRPYYSPFFMALALLLDGETVDARTFEVVVQGLTPYSSDAIKEAVRSRSIRATELEEAIRDIEIQMPDKLAGSGEIGYDVFQSIFKGSKSNDSTSKTYYDFYCALKALREQGTEEAYEALLVCLDGEKAAALNKAFGYGKAVFAAGNRGSRYSLDKFMEKNAHHPLLVSEDFVGAFYAAYKKSKWVDGIREYSDTTVRLLSATGLFHFKNLPKLAYREILSVMFDVGQLRAHVFGEMTEEEFMQYEGGADCSFAKNVPLGDIFHYSKEDVSAITENMKRLLGVNTAEDVKKRLDNQRSADFRAYIRENYPKEKIMELLPLFSDRRKDARIKREVYDAASVPTIYEYIVGIAWYYISNQEFDLYNSLNLTLNADFEPVIHAGGGEGDLVISYEERTVMLEVTLMNKQAQKRGEWEPVLRHSLNLKAANEPKETITFFIADELDYNTVNIWRAVASVSLESTDTHTKVAGVIIMPFTNREILTFLEKNIYYKDVVDAVKASYARLPQIADVKWHEEIVSNLIGEAPR